MKISEQIQKAIVFLMFFVIVLSSQSLDTLKIKVGEEAPTFYLRTLTGEDFYLRDYSGEKLRQPWKHKDKYTVILSFFATWCVPCQLEIPILHQWVKEQSDSSLKVLLIDVAEKQNEVAPFIKKKGYTLPVLLDVYNMVADKQFGIKSLPHLVIIDPNGYVRLITKGFKDEKTLRLHLDETMAEIRKGTEAAPEEKEKLK